MATTPPLKKCSNCAVEYPAALVTSLYEFTQGSGRKITYVCGICALIMVNEHSDNPRPAFNGVEAESLRQAAIAYRKSKNI